MINPILLNVVHFDLCHFLFLFFLFFTAPVKRAAKIVLPEIEAVEVMAPPSASGFTDTVSVHGKKVSVSYLCNNAAPVETTDAKKKKTIRR